MPYLLIGDDDDLCCSLVCSMLRGRNCRVYVTPEPFTGSMSLAWFLDTTSSRSILRLDDGRVISDADWDGVLVRAQGEPRNAEQWKQVDEMYVGQESRAALLAWLWMLPCPVVNRLDADLWFRPYHSFPEWQTLFTQCALPTPALHITNNPASACRFADRWKGSTIYAPLTSYKHYLVSTAEQWNDLTTLMKHVPVALIEPTTDASFYATLVREQIVWSDDSYLCGEERIVFEAKLLHLRQLLHIDFLQVVLASSERGPLCTDLSVFPQLDHHSSEQQRRIAIELTALLEKGR